jgi:hypothetical protein
MFKILAAVAFALLIALPAVAPAQANSSTPRARPHFPETASARVWRLPSYDGGDACVF